LELLYFLRSNKRFGDLQEETHDISPTTLTRRLRELEKAGLLKRTVIPTFPPTVEYELSDMGEELRPMIDVLTHWSRRWGAPIEKAT
jgi:DNA-binding HxlR family transcriptional regulator